MKVLITSPSLNENENVSGISTMISSVIANSDCKFTHFTAGRKDGEKSGLKWLVSQSKLPFAFRRAIDDAKPDVIHINTALEPRAIVRDAILARLAKKHPLVVHVHGGRFGLDQTPSPWINLIANDLLKSARRVVVLSDEEAESILKRVPGIEIRVLPNAIATDSFPARKK